MTEYAWHVHHEALWEDLTEPIERRIQYIKENKPQKEIATRLRLLKPVKDTSLMLKLAPIDKDYEDKRAPIDKAIEKLHKKECPNCPWNGRTIFPEGN